MREIEFTEDFASKKKGEVWECDSMLANQLVNVDKVAKYYEKPSRATYKSKSDND